MQLTSAHASLAINLEYGGRLESLVLFGHEVLVPRHPVVFFWGSFPMAPWVGRTRGARFEFDGTEYLLPVNTETHSMHGTVYGRPWRHVGDTTIECDLGPDWPFPGFARQRFELADDHLTMHLEVHATERPMPAACGWHPWFPRVVGGSHLDLRFEAAAMEVRRGDTIELVEPAPPPWDQCFDGVVWPIVLTWPGVVELSVTSDCTKAVMYDRHELGVCVEPQTDRPDSLNLGTRVVQPGSPLTAWMRWDWREPVD